VDQSLARRPAGRRLAFGCVFVRVGASARRPAEASRRMFDFIRAGGWVMWPILGCSVVALAIILERLWTLRMRRVCPPRVRSQLWHWIRHRQLDSVKIGWLRDSSPLGRVLAAGLINASHSREVMKESIEETGRHVVHGLERYLNTLGTISAVSPLLGLLGTVIGMMRVFDAIAAVGVGNPRDLAPGIATALITTIAGLCVAIPSLIFYRYFRGRVDELVIAMEREALRMVEVLHGEREQNGEGEA
jgi:biopolymer transport protein ExbB